MDITCKSGTIYGIATGFGTMEELSVAFMENVSNETIEALQAEAIKQGQGLEEMNEAALTKSLEPEAVKQLLTGSRVRAAKMIAIALRSVNGQRLADFNARYDYTMDELNWSDGLELAIAIKEHLREMKEGADLEGEITAQLQSVASVSS